jgi:predicted DNA-binding ribbon-helix-helix protein
MPGKRVQFDGETWLALDVLARDRMMSFQELADEAFRDPLKKHHRPLNLKSALKRSAGLPAEVRDPPARTRKRIKAGA